MKKIIQRGPNLSNQEIESLNFCYIDGFAYALWQLRDVKTRTLLHLVHTAGDVYQITDGHPQVNQTYFMGEITGLAMLRSLVAAYGGNWAGELYSND